jgi:hypothetical protein
LVAIGTSSPPTIQLRSVTGRIAAAAAIAISALATNAARTRCGGRASSHANSGSAGANASTVGRVIAASPNSSPPSANNAFERRRPATSSASSIAVASAFSTATLSSSPSK